MTLRVDVKPELLRWSRERAGIPIDALVRRFPRYLEWESGERQPTLKQLESLARTTHAPIGSFFLSQPLDEPFPIPDLRTIGDVPVGRHSVELRDTVYLCLQRQDWYRDYARIEGEDPLAFVGSATPRSDVETTAGKIRAELGFNVEERRSFRTWTEALRRFIEQADALGVLVMTSGIVGNNTHRRLDPEEFRGFALSDDLAPLVFINGADTKGAQMFTLAHELGHIWLGESALYDVDPVSSPAHEVEGWCNRVAAEILVPRASLIERYRENEEPQNQLNRLAREFKVSTLVVLRRLHDVGALNSDELALAYGRELERIRTIEPESGGSFRPSLKARVGQRFAGAIAASTLGGRTSFTESVRLHERESFCGIVSVSRANQAAAFDKISRSMRNCLFSRRNRASSFRSCVVRPSARRPSSRSACATQLRIVGSEGSNSFASSRGVRPVRISSTICCRNSGAYAGRAFGMVYLLSSHQNNKKIGVHQIGSSPKRGVVA